MGMIADLERIARKSPPGPPPRPGLIWHDETSRWRLPEEMIDEDLPGGQIQPQSEKPSQEDPQEAQGAAQEPSQGAAQAKPMPIEEVAKRAVISLDSAVKQLSQIFPNFEVKGRAKDPDSIRNKVSKYEQEGRGVPAEKLTDLIGMRIHTNNFSEVYEAVQVLRNMLPVVLEKDYNKQPNDYYRSYHFLTTFDGIGTEIQIRLPAQTVLFDWSHKNLYKPESRVPMEVKEAGVEYARAMSEYYSEIIDISPDCPPAVERWFGCLD